MIKINAYIFISASRNESSGGNKRTSSRPLQSEPQEKKSRVSIYIEKIIANYLFIKLFRYLITKSCLFADYILYSIITLRIIFIQINCYTFL